MGPDWPCLTDYLLEAARHEEAKQAGQPLSRFDASLYTRAMEEIEATLRAAGVKHPDVVASDVVKNAHEMLVVTPNGRELLYESVYPPYTYEQISEDGPPEHWWDYREDLITDPEACARVSVLLKGEIWPFD